MHDDDVHVSHVRGDRVGIPTVADRMVGRRDVHPNKNVHVVTESFNDVKESNMVIDDYIEKKKEKMMRERERLEEMSKKKRNDDDADENGEERASSSTKKGKDHHSKKSSRKRNKTLTRANEWI